MGFVGSAGHGSVRVELSEAGAAVGVQLLHGWRAAAAERLGPTVLQAFAAAVSARLQAQAAGPPPAFDFTAAAALRALGSGHDTAVLLADAAQDLREYVRQLAARFDGYGELKGAVADAVVGTLTPLRERYLQLAAEPERVRNVLRDGAARARRHAAGTVRRARTAIGLLPC